VEVVHEKADAIGVCGGGERRKPRAITPAESEQVDDDDAVAFRHFSHDAVPQMRRRREPVQENDRLARAARARGVVVESRDTQVHKLAAHRGKMDTGRDRDKHARATDNLANATQIRAKNREFALAFRDENGILSACASLCAERAPDRIV